MKSRSITIFYFLISACSSISPNRVEKENNFRSERSDTIKDEPFKDPDLYRDVPALINSRGFKSQKYEIQTEDGYILSLYRIINPFFKGNKTKPIMLQHGIISSGRDWIVNSPGGNVHEMFTQNDTIVGNNLGFELGKRGYDVWLANSRGNTYSRKHVKLSPKQPQFWDYSFDQMIKYDLPATIDFIRKTTKQSKFNTNKMIRTDMTLFYFRNDCIHWSLSRFSNYVWIIINQQKVQQTNQTIHSPISSCRTSSYQNTISILNLRSWFTNCGLVHSRATFSFRSPHESVHIDGM